MWQIKDKLLHGDIRHIMYRQDCLESRVERGHDTDMMDKVQWYNRQAQLLDEKGIFSHSNWSHHHMLVCNF